MNIFKAPNGEVIELPDNIATIIIPSAFKIEHGHVINGYITIKPEPKPTQPEHPIGSNKKK